jgi:hypothetical protein
VEASRHLHTEATWSSEKESPVPTERRLGGIQVSLPQLSSSQISFYTTLTMSKNWNRIIPQLQRVIQIRNLTKFPLVATKVSYEKWHMENQGHSIMISFTSICAKTVQKHLFPNLNWHGVMWLSPLKNCGVTLFLLDTLYVRLCIRGLIPRHGLAYGGLFLR